MQSTDTVIWKFPTTTASLLTDNAFVFKSPSMDQWFVTTNLHHLLSTSADSVCGTLKSSTDGGSFTLVDVTPATATDGSTYYTFDETTGGIIVNSNPDISQASLVMTVRFKVKYTDADVFFNEDADESEIKTATILIEPMVITWTEPSLPKPLDGPFYAKMDIAQEVALPNIVEDLTNLGFTH